MNSREASRKSRQSRNILFGNTPFECYFTEVIPPNNLRWLSQSPPPPCLHFPSKFEWSPSESFQSFQRSPFWVLSYDWSPFLFSSKLSDPPTKILPPAINNDWSLKSKYYILQCLRPTSQISSSSSNEKVGRRGSQIQKPIRNLWNLTMEFLEGWSLQQSIKTLSTGGMDTLWNYTLKYKSYCWNFFRHVYEHSCTMAW